MNIGCGTDIIEVERIKNSIEKLQEKFLNRVFTEKEIEYCNKKNNMKYQHFAARFAAKEATFKALSNLLDNKYDIEWKDIEILNDENGRPYINLNMDKINNKIKIENFKIDISMSHIKEYATANCMIVY